MKFNLWCNTKKEMIQMSKLLILICCFFLGACVYSQHSKESVSGTALEATQLQKIEVGKTTKQWVLVNFGIPERTYTEENNFEVFEYVSEIKKTNNSKLIFLFNINSEDVGAQKVTRIVLRKGVVESVVSK
jgi:outer membrane protein assembly factor BamE (lipoprotein component of BamABCDE complex)